MGLLEEKTEFPVAGLLCLQITSKLYPAGCRITGQTEFSASAGHLCKSWSRKLESTGTKSEGLTGTLSTEPLTPEALNPSV